jgi:hypothetical protein
MQQNANVRYQVFVSSTFRDLRAERQAALDAILELGHFPAGMEIFPAADATPWELIESIIRDSDYYVLIIGGRYGSAGPEGISYTEMEYELALRLKKPILAFLHGNPDAIPAGQSEMDGKARQRLEAFRQRVSDRHTKNWSNKDELKTAVLLALVHAIRTIPAAGWVRNEGLDNRELLKRLVTLQARHDELEEEAKALRKASSQLSFAENLQSMDEEFPVDVRETKGGESFTVSMTWNALFYGLARYMLIPIEEWDLNRLICGMVASVLVNTPRGDQFVVDKTKDQIGQVRRAIGVNQSSVTTIMLQFMAHGLVEPWVVERQRALLGRDRVENVECWVLTTEGRRRFLSRAAVRAE